MTGVLELLAYMSGRRDAPTLPPPPPDFENEDAEEPLPPRGPDEPHWVLIVDDDSDAREFVAIILRQEGYEVTSRNNGYSAIQHLEKRFMRRHLGGYRRYVPSVILLDWMMPQMDGFEFYHQLRMNPARYDVETIVVVSAFGEAVARALPWVAIVSKPVDVPHLLEVIARKAAGAP